MLELTETAAEEVSVRWKQPQARVMGSRLQPVLPLSCEGVGKPRVEAEASGMVATWRIRCLGGLSGRSVGVEGIASSRAAVLLRVVLADGRSHSKVLTADAPALSIEARAGVDGVLRDYGVLGAEHILTGWDHLLFVLGLVLLVGPVRKLLWSRFGRESAADTAAKPHATTSTFT